MSTKDRQRHLISAVVQLVPGGLHLCDSVSLEQFLLNSGVKAEEMKPLFNRLLQDRILCARKFKVPKRDSILDLIPCVARSTQAEETSQLLRSWKHGDTEEVLFYAATPVLLGMLGRIPHSQDLKYVLACYRQSVLLCDFLKTSLTSISDWLPRQSTWEHPSARATAS